jgi:hypothetical protein
MTSLLKVPGLDELASTATGYRKRRILKPLVPNRFFLHVAALKPDGISADQLFGYMSARRRIGSTRAQLKTGACTQKGCSYEH